MTTVQTAPSAVAWKGAEKIAFRFLFLYFFIQAVPLDWKYYATLFRLPFTGWYYGDIFSLTRY